MATSTEAVSPAEAYSEHLLHYIGSQLYGIPRFVAESKRIGAQRTCTFGILSKLHYGDKILLAQHQKLEQVDQVTGAKKDPIPTAIVFGYLRVNGMTHNLPKEVSEQVLKRLHVDEYEAPAGGGMEESRACGSYMVGGVAYVQENIPEICSVIEAVCKEQGIAHDRKPVKYFVRGTVTTFDKPLVLEDTPFTRMYLKVKLNKNEVDLSGGEAPKHAIFQISNYERREYMKKEDGAAYDRALLDEYTERVGGKGS